jgi:ABC-type ATPase with predicted acetyltransferase domain
MLSNIKVKTEFKKEEFTEKERVLIEDIFGIFAADIYFRIEVNQNLKEHHKFVNFFGISGSGKTVIKDLIKAKLKGEIPITNDGPLDSFLNGDSENETKKILDFDDLEYFSERFKDNTILELFEITDNKDPILKILSGFGLFEIRLLTAKISELSTGQRTRLKYVYLIKQIDETVDCNYILIDEFLTFVDSLSSVSFARTLRKYIENKNVQFFGFGVNDALINNYEDITLVLGNTKINGVIENGEYLELCRLPFEGEEYKK